MLSRVDPKTMGMTFPDGQVRYVDRDVVSRITGVVSGPSLLGLVLYKTGFE